MIFCEKYVDFCKEIFVKVAVLNLKKKKKFPVSETRGAAPLPPCSQTQGNVLFLTKTKPLQEKCGLSGSYCRFWQSSSDFPAPSSFAGAAAPLPSPLSALCLGLESQRVKNSLRDVCSSYPASPLPCQGYQTHAFVLSSRREQILSPSELGEPRVTQVPHSAHTGDCSSSNVCSGSSTPGRPDIV